MTKAQKKRFKKLDGAKAKRAFLIELRAQQERLGDYGHWVKAYARICAKKGLDNPAA